VNVKDKGAKGDRTTDDTAAIQAAIDKAGGTGGTVLVPKGTYMNWRTRSAGWCDSGAAERRRTAGTAETIGAQAGKLGELG
jgi:hypothetical protein